MKRAAKEVYLSVLSFLVPSLAGIPVDASQPGRIAAALVRESSYRHFLEDMLFTHPGDDRWFGPEHDLARENIVTIMSSYGLNIELEPFDYQGETYYNVVATKFGATNPDRIYIVGAHFDSINYLDPESGAPGANDNASSVALVLEAARVLATFESDYTIRFVAFDREEQVLIGSWAYALAHADEEIQGVIVADEIAYDNGQYAVDIWAQTASMPLAEALLDAVAMYGNGIGSQHAGSTGLSDHAPFETLGIPACLVTQEYSQGSPNVHTSLDHVEMPCYIDYAYAANTTRAVVGFLVDHAGVDVDYTPDADYDGDDDVDIDDYNEFALCFTDVGGSVDPGCEHFDFETDADVDCDDWNLFAAVWTGPPVDTPVFWPCFRPKITVASGANRCLIVTPPEHDLPLALLVTGQPDGPTSSCPPQYVQTDGHLGPSSVFQTNETWGTVNICDESIVPGTMYIVQCDFGDQGSPALSPDTCIDTAIWGDTVGDFVVGSWTPPNGTVDFNDISSVVDAFRHLPTAPATMWVDLVGTSGNECTPDLGIDFLDIGAAVDAFRGFTYWQTTSCPAPCE